jgi:acyl-CoA reductase-like NAD-dependent aldehyde dehydrogenase
VAQDLTYRLYIDGKWVDASGDETLTVINPATEAEIGVVPQATVADARAAIKAARTAFDEGPWGRSTPMERAAVIARMADILQRRWDELIELNIAEAGSTRMLAQFLQVGAPLEHLRDYAERVLPSYQFDTPMMPYIGAGGMAGIGQGVVQREAIGVAALITPYNFPLFLNVFKLGPALAAGCTTVLKPSPDTPLEALILGEIAEEAGLPPGVLNIVTGDIDASAELTRNPMVDMVSFTGSDAVGRRVYAQASDTLKRVVLELGGKSANIVFEDADLAKVVPNVIQNFTIHAGQGCSLLTRTLVHESLFDELVGQIKSGLDQVKVGDPADDSVGMGPLISAAQRERVEALVHTGQEEGAQIAYGGNRPTGPSAPDKGFFFEPTVFVDVDNSMTISRREVFGPVSVIIPFTDDEQAVAIANDSDFGLGGGVWSGDPVRAYKTARRMRTGSVIVNGGGGGGLNPHAPFGGYKQSGLGREWGTAGLEEYLQQKAITWGAGNA